MQSLKSVWYWNANVSGPWVNTDLSAAVSKVKNELSARGVQNRDRLEFAQLPLTWLLICWKVCDVVESSRTRGFTVNLMMNNDQLKVKLPFLFSKLNLSCCCVTYMTLCGLCIMCLRVKQLYVHFQIKLCI